MEKEFCPYCMAPVELGEACGICGLTSGTYTASPHHLPPGTVLRDRYLVGRVLGEGGFGITYIGCDLMLELKVAIKEYFPTDKASRIAQASLSVSSYAGVAGERYEVGKKRFLQEARTMAQLEKQPVIVSVRDFFEINNTAYIVMEYVDGTTFKELVAQRGGRIGAGELLHMMEPLFFALSAMHEVGLIHRDISPENLMLERGEVRLLDFGCARQSNDGEATLTIALKHGYAPVEQYQNKGQGPWTDVYALSATLYYCLTGRKPPQSMDRLMEDELVTPRQLGVDLTERQERALLYGMGVRPKRRFQSVQQMHAALYEGGVVPGPAPEPVPAPEPIAVSGPEPIPVLPPEPGRGIERTILPGEATEPASAVKTVESAPDSEARPEEAAGERGENLWEKAVAWVKADRQRLQAVIAAAAVALILMVAFPVVSLLERNAQDGGDVAHTGGTAGEENSGQSPGGDPAQSVDLSIFDGASYLPTGSETLLREYLLDEGTKAVVIPSGDAIELSEPLEITKPLLIEEGAYLGGIHPVAVASGGYLRVAGELNTEGVIRTAGGGTIGVAGSGTLRSLAMVWLERAEDLTVEEGGVTDVWGAAYGAYGRDESRYLVFSEEIFEGEGVTHVETVGQYIMAIQSQHTKAIVVDADMTFNSGNLDHSVPVLISEGVTVTAPVDDSTGLYCAWDVNGTVLVNRGTLRGRVVTGDWDLDVSTERWAIINYGTMEYELHTDMSASGNILNLGEMELLNGDIAHGSSLYNLETLRLTGDSKNGNWLSLRGETFYNYGELSIHAGEHEETGLTLAGGIRFGNVGSLRLEQGGRLEMTANCVNFGEIAIEEGGELWNTGLIEDLGRLEERQEGGYQRDANGFLLYDPASPPALARDMEAYNTRSIPFIGGVEEGVRYVYSAPELQSALEDEGCAVVVAQGSITLPEAMGEVPVEKGLVVSGDLTTGGGNLTIQGEGAFLLANGLDLGGYSLRVRDGATAVTGDLFNGSLVLEGGSRLLSMGHLEPGTEIAISHGSELSCLSDLTLEGTELVLEGELHCYGDLHIDSSRLEVLEDSWVNLQGGLYMCAASTIENRGGFVIGGWGESYRMLGGSVTNWGYLACGSTLRLTGRLVNHGEMEVWDWGEFFQVSGTLDNQGAVYMHIPAQTVGGGLITGNAVIKEYE